MDDYIAPAEPVQAATAPRPAPMPWARIGLLGIAVAAILAAAILAFGSTAAPTSILAAGTTTTTDNAAGTIEDLNGINGRGRGFGHGGVTVTAISGSSISLATGDGWTRTITVDSGTTYMKSNVAITLGDLQVGDQVGFRQTKETDGSYSIDAIVVIPPHLGGRVTTVSGSTITVTQRDGTTGTIRVTGDTTYKIAGAAATLADVKVGMFLLAEGTDASDGSLTAASVRAGNFGDRGPGGRGDHFGDNKNGNAPDSKAAPSATSSAG